MQEEENFEAKEDEIRRYSSKLLTICKTGWVATPADSLNPHPAHNGRSLPTSQVIVQIFKREIHNLYLRGEYSNLGIV